MGYATVMFAVDLDRIQRIVADHDASVLQVVRTAQPERFEATLFDGDPTLGQALECILRGEGFDPAHAHQYGYALKLLCEVLGEWLPDDDLLGALEPLELQSPLEHFRTPVDMPANRDFPYISYLTTAEVQREAERVAALDLTFPDDEDIEEAREAYAQCIQAAAEAGKAIVAFYH